MVPREPESDDADDRTRPMRTERLTTLGKFSVEEKIGEGGMGVVYRAYDADLHRRVAIKRLLPKFDSDSDLRERFTSEARSIAAVTHPNIAQIFSIHDHSESGDGAPYFVMEFVDGRSTDEVVEEDGPLDPDRALAIARQAALGLRAAAAEGIVHRDVKPSNLVLDPTGAVKLVDFGLSRPVFAKERTGTDPGTVLGTPHYLAPEQARGWKADPRADMYSLGCTLFFLLTGKPPFHGHKSVDLLVAHSSTEPPKVSELSPEVPRPVVHFVARLLEKDPDRRFADYDELLQALDDCRKSGRPTEKTPAAISKTAIFVVILATIAVVVAVDRGWVRNVSTSRRPEVERYLGESHRAIERGARESIVFEFDESIPPGVFYARRAADQSTKVPSILGDNLSWSNFESPIALPWLERFEELEISGLKLDRGVDLEIRLGDDPTRPQNWLSLALHAGREESLERAITAYWLGEPARLQRPTRSTEFTFIANRPHRIVLGLSNASTRPSSSTPGVEQVSLQLRIFRQPLEGDRGADQLILDETFLVPAPALQAGRVTLRTEGRQPDWRVRLSRIALVGWLNADRVHEQIRAQL